MKKIAVLGSTGKIGSQALKIIKDHPKDFKVVGLACKNESKKFLGQIKDFKPKIYASLKKDGEKGILKVATHKDVDMVVIAVVGLAGLKPTLKAIKAKKDIALATKEVLVIAGKLVLKEAKKHKVNIIPIDSEPSAIFQSLGSLNSKKIRQIYLTVGKGPIAKMSKQRLKKVSLKDIFNRPVWNLGQKIAVDSATGMNKAFEVIEIARLFNLKASQIKLAVHPEYLCHSLVEFVDASIIGEFGKADMKRYISYALFYPQRQKAKSNLRLDLINKKISFERPDYDKFPCLRLGHKALKDGGTMPAVLHGADKAAVEAFLQAKIKFTDIFKIISLTMKAHKVIKKPTLKQVLKAEKWAQEYSFNLTKGKKKLVSAVLTCAGNGTRFGRNKVLSKIKGKTVLQRTVGQFLKSKLIDEVIVTAQKHDINLYKKILKKAKLKARVVEGGEQRIISALNGVKTAKGKYVLVHDGVRPLTPVWLINKVVKTTFQHGAAIAAVNPTATIKHNNKDLAISKSYPRAATWIAQTPQGFKKKWILAAYKQAIKNNYFTPTDDSELVAKLGKKIKIVPGDYANIKITFPVDLAIAESLLRFKKET